MNPELLIIADDLTGACDTAVQFARTGRRAAVSLSTELEKRPGSATVVAIDTESRHLPAAQAADRVSSVVKSSRALGFSRLYKKIDSTFRGNIGAELEALLTATGAKRLILVPAYPAAGRVTRGGCQYVDGVPLHRTAFAHDPLAPVTQSSIPTIIARQSSVPVTVIGRGESVAGETGIFVLDGETDRDLETAAELFEKSDGSTLFAGTAGFAEFMARRLSPAKSAPPARPVAERLLVINGSLNEVSLDQVKYARARGLPCISLCDCPGSDAMQQKALLSATMLGVSRCVIASTARPPAGGAEDFLTKAASFSGFLSQSLTAGSRPALAIFGGDTAASVCSALGIRFLYPEQEIVPGLTVCSCGGESCFGPVILKSGGFGPPDAIAMILSYCGIPA